MSWEAAGTLSHDRLNRIYATLEREQARRDLAEIKIAAWAHFAGTNHDPNAGNRERDRIWDAFHQIAYPATTQRDPDGRRFRWDAQTSSSDLKAWFMNAGAVVS